MSFLLFFQAAAGSTDSDVKPKSIDEDNLKEDQPEEIWIVDGCLYERWLDVQFHTQGDLKLNCLYMFAVWYPVFWLF